jgi:hypothetical protein
VIRAVALDPTNSNQRYAAGETGNVYSYTAQADEPAPPPPPPAPPPVPSSGGGGGGSADFFFLLALGQLILFRYALRFQRRLVYSVSA